MYVSNITQSPLAPPHPTPHPPQKKKKQKKGKKEGTRLLWTKFRS